MARCGMRALLLEGVQSWWAAEWAGPSPRHCHEVAMPGFGVDAARVGRGLVAGECVALGLFCMC